MQRAAPVDEVVRCLEPLTTHAVEALVRLQIDLVAVVELLDEPLHRSLVTRLSGADEVVVGDIEGLPDDLPARDDLVRPGLRVEALGLGGPQDLLAMFVRAG